MMKASFLSTLLAVCMLAFCETPAQAATAPATGTAVLQYRLATGDTVRVTVFQNPDLTLEVRINENGNISYPLLGVVPIGGMTVAEAEKRIADGLREGNFVKQPQVSLLVTQVRGNQVSVLGQVGKPGRFPLESADMRLTDVIADAGGVSPIGSDTVIVIGTRDGKAFRVAVDLPALFSSDRRNGDLLMQNGDVVWVERAPQVYVYGEVQKPGALRLERGMTVMQALSTGGGLTQRGTERGLRVHRRDADGKVSVIDVNLIDLLKPDDVLYVRESVF
jgi:polysaccharide export outer membrane protein